MRKIIVHRRRLKIRRLKLKTQEAELEPEDRAEEADEQHYVEASWSGPIPPPSIMNDYNHVVENGAERIFNQFEQEAHHRRARERRSDDAVSRGQFLAGAYALAVILLAGYAFHEHANVAGTLISGGAITGGIIAFLGVRASNKNENEGSKTSAPSLIQNSGNPPTTPSISHEPDPKA